MSIGKAPRAPLNESVESQEWNMGIVIYAENVEQIGDRMFRINVKGFPKDLLNKMEELLPHTFEDFERLLSIEALLASVKK